MQPKPVGCVKRTMTPGNWCDSRTLRNWLLGCAMAAVVLGLVHTWLLDGLIVPYRVVGGSMAGGLLGKHRQVVCGDCGFSFSCGSDSLPVSGRAVCPNCGYAGNDLTSLPDVAGPRVVIDRSALSIRRPRRWEVVAFRRPTHADEMVIKRVVGLPGESIEICDGDVYADGQVVRKDLAQQRALRVLVNDSNFQPRESSSPARWQAAGTSGRWTSDSGRFLHAGGAVAGSVDWLAYHNWRRIGDKCVERPITDVDGYSQALLRRAEDVSTVRDLMLSLRLERVSGRGGFLVRMGDGSRAFQAELRFGDSSAARYVIMGVQTQPGQPITAGAVDGTATVSGEISNLPNQVIGTDILVEVSLVDRQFLLAVDGRTVACVPYEPAGSPSAAPSCPVAVGAAGIAVTVGELRLYRDVYYTRPVVAAERGFAPTVASLAADEYYVLGDNSPISEDSRIWPERGIADKLLMGKPLVAVPSAALHLWGHLYIQVPNPRGIRYIR